MHALADEILRYRQALRQLATAINWADEGKPFGLIAPGPYAHRLREAGATLGRAILSRAWTGPNEGTTMRRPLTIAALVAALLLLTAALVAPAVAQSDELADVWQAELQRCRQLAPPEVLRLRPGYCEAQADAKLRRERERLQEEAKSNAALENVRRQQEADRRHLPERATRRRSTTASRPAARAAKRLASR